MPQVFEFNPTAPEFKANPYAYYGALREATPVFFLPDWNMWFLSRYEDCVALLRDHRLGHEILKVMTPEELGWNPEPPVDVLPLIQMRNKWMLIKDPPDHTRLRMLVHKAFTPRVVETLRGRIQTITDALLDRVQSQGVMDVVEHLALPLPVTVIAELLGIPEADWDRFRRWSRGIAGTLELDPGHGDWTGDWASATRAAVEFSDYLKGLIAERRTHPRDDLVSALAAAEEAGDKLNERELISTCILLLVAGHETTVNLIGSGVYALLRHPDEMRRLQDDPALIKTAVEEFLRYDSPVQMTARFALEDMEFAGQTFRKGQQVGIMLAAANRDPAQFDNPDALDITRQDNKHIAFGNGIHYCVGAPLARVEGEIAISTLLRRMPDIRLSAAPPHYRPTFILRGLKSLPVEF